MFSSRKTYIYCLYINLFVIHLSSSIFNSNDYTHSTFIKWQSKVFALYNLLISMENLFEVLGFLKCHTINLKREICTFVLFKSCFRMSQWDKSGTNLTFIFSLHFPLWYYSIGQTLCYKSTIQRAWIVIPTGHILECYPIKCV